MLAIVTVATEGDAIRLTNQSPYALGASIFSRDISRAHRVGKEILAGVITINDLIIPTADARLPFGGRRNSGFGVTRGSEGLLELTTPKVITTSRSKFRPAFKQPKLGDVKMFSSYLSLVHSVGFNPKVSALMRLVKNILQRKSTITSKLK